MFRLYCGFTIEGSKFGNTVSAAVSIKAMMTRADERKAGVLRSAPRDK